MQPAVNRPSRILVRNDWNSLPSTAWKIFAIVHEWGHNMGLNDHHNSDDPNPADNDACFGLLPTVMDGDVNTSGNTCPQSPTFGDRASVGCIYHCDERPAVTSWGNNRLDVFARGADLPHSSLYHKRWTGGSNWSGWLPVAGCLTSAPGAASWGGQRLDVFVRGCDQNGNLYHRASGDGGNTWTAWDNLGGCTRGSPAATAWGPNRVDVFVRGCDDALYHKYWVAGLGWLPPNPSDFYYRGGLLSSGPAVATRGANKLAVFVRGYAGDLHWKEWTGGTWPSDFIPLGGCLGAEPYADSFNSSRFDVMVRGCASDMFQFYSSNATDGDASFMLYALQGCFSSGAGVASQLANQLDVFARWCQSGGNLFRRKWVSTTGWNSWSILSGWPPP
jgi:hypothetical protein